MSSTRHYYQSSSYRRSRRRRRRSRRSLKLLAPGFVALFLIALVGIGFAGSSDRIATGVEVAGTDVGGMTTGEARRTLEKAYQKLVWVPADFVAAGKHFKITPAQLGVQVDWKTAVETARRDGDGFGPLRGFKRLEMRFFGTDVTPPVTHSAPALNKYLSEVARSVNRPVREPALVLSGSQPSIVSGSDGRALNRAAAGRLVIAALGSLSRHTVTLPVRAIAPRVKRADMMRVAGQVRTVVSAPVMLSLGAVRWKISPAQIEKMLVYPHNGVRNLRIAGDKADAYLGRLAKQLDRPARDATFAVSGPTVQLVPSRLGRVIDREGTAAAILRAALDPVNRIAPLVMAQTEPKRTTEQARAMGITGLVGRYETSFTGTANRIHNVELVAKLIDDKYIAPGAVFSFNQTTGERNSKKGFLSAPVIINGELSEALGGGVCQVSTTVFNAAYESGLPILERTNHALYISHYPLGRDATVNWPSTDLKFRNDTDHWMLLRTFASSDTLLVALYGEPQHRRVVSDAQPLHIDGPPPIKKIPDPKLPLGKKVVKELGESSSSTSVRRRVYDANGKLLYDDVFRSSYRSSPKVVLVGTKKKPKTTTTKTTTTKTTTTDTTTTDTTGDSGFGDTTTLPYDTTTTG
jgi:vancomycin resistance protein YoaR